MRRLRILYHHRIRADDGQAVHVKELIDALRAEGHEVVECALVAKARPDDAAGGGPPRARGVWQRLRLPRAATEALEIVYGRHGARRLLAAARGQPFDFVYERHALHCRAGLLAARALRVPLLLEVNSPMCDEMQRLGLLCFPKLARHAEREVLAGADRVLAVTHVLAGRLAQLGADPGRTLVIGNAADPARMPEPDEGARAAARAALGLPQGAFAVAFVGFMRAWHRLELVLDAMAKDGLAPTHLVLAGDGPALAPALAHAQRLGLSARVHALGRVPQDRIAVVLAGADAALIPAINEYASPLKLFDSLAAGVVTLAPRQPNLLESIADGVDGVLFTPGNVDSLAERLAFLLRDPARAKALGRAGRAKLIASDWTWRGNARRVIAAFEAVRA